MKTSISGKISKNNFFFKYISYFFIIQNLSKNLIMTFILIKNWLSIWYVRFYETWYFKTLRKIHENFQ